MPVKGWVMRQAGWIIAMLFGTLAAASAAGEEIHVFAAGASQSVIEAATEHFGRASGHHLNVEVDTVGALRDRVLAGARPDVVILSRVAVDRLAAAGLIGGQRVHIGDIPFGLAVARGTPLPDISTREALRRTLLSTQSIAYGSPERGATAGTHFQRILTELGVLEEVRPRLMVVPFGGDAVRAVAEGRAALAVSQASEIVAVPGVTMLGALPPEFWLATPYEAASLGAEAPPGVRALLDFLNGPEGSALFRSAGFVK
jgi:molybdate transport system substrate-binding protein